MLGNTLQLQGHETYFTAKQKCSMIPNVWKIEDRIFRQVWAQIHTAWIPCSSHPFNTHRASSVTVHFIFIKKTNGQVYSCVNETWETGTAKVGSAVTRTRHNKIVTWHSGALNKQLCISFLVIHEYHYHTDTFLWKSHKHDTFIKDDWAQIQFCPVPEIMD